MTILKTLAALAQSAIELPNALHACVEMAREAEANRASIRASDAFESVLPNGPALYHANSQIEALKKELESRAQAFDAQADEIDKEARRCAELAFKLRTQESELAKLCEFANWHNEEAPRGILVVIRAPARADDLRMILSSMLRPSQEWRYARLEDVP